MSSIMEVVKRTKQPEEGYLRFRDLVKTPMDGDETLVDEDDIDLGVIGVVVDSLVRLTNGTPKELAFRQSILHAGEVNDEERALQLLESIKGLDDSSIINACKLGGYGVIFGYGMDDYTTVDKMMPSENTINDIRVLVDRCNNFFKTYEDVRKTTFKFTNAYTSQITEGYGDFLTDTMLVTIKYSRKELTEEDTLKLLIYYVMSVRSTDERDFKTIKEIGIFNPRTNLFYSIQVDKIPESIINTIKDDVVGY